MPRTILDVSRWQGRIDWDKVKASGLVSGVMIRAMGNSGARKASLSSMSTATGSWKALPPSACLNRASSLSACALVVALK